MKKICTLLGITSMAISSVTTAMPGVESADHWQLNEMFEEGVAPRGYINLSHCYPDNLPPFIEPGIPSQLQRMSISLADSHFMREQIPGEEDKFYFGFTAGVSHRTHTGKTDVGLLTRGFTVNPGGHYTYHATVSFEGNTHEISMTCEPEALNLRF